MSGLIFRCVWLTPPGRTSAVQILLMTKRESMIKKIDLLNKTFDLRSTYASSVEWQEKLKRWRNCLLTTSINTPPSPQPVLSW